MTALRLLGCAALTAAMALPAAAETVALRAGRILTGTGQTITGGVILIKDGKILAIGKGVELPEGVKVVDLSGKTVIPGLVAAGSQIGVAGNANEESSEITPTFEVAGALDPGHVSVRRALALGITTAYVRPGLRNVIGGMGAIVRPGEAHGDFVARRAQELLIPVGPWPASGNGSPDWYGTSSPRARRPTTRLATVWLIRKSFIDARRYLATGSMEGLAKEAPGAYSKAELDVLARVLQGKQRVRFFAQSDRDVRTVLRLVAEFKIPRFRIEGLVEAYRGPKALAGLKDGLIAHIQDVNPLQAEQPLAMPVQMVLFTRWFNHKHHPGAQDKAEFDERIRRQADHIGCSFCALGAEGAVDTRQRQTFGIRLDNLTLLCAQNQRVSLTTDDAVPDLLGAATLAVRHGLDPERALATLTREPARSLGLGRQLGTLTVGRRADLVVLSGEPFELTSRIEAVYSGGRQVHPSR